MANPNIETFKGEPPKCRNCGDKLKPRYETEKDRVNNPRGRKRIYTGDHEYVGDEPAHLWWYKDGIFTWYWDAKRKEWFRYEHVYKIVSRKFLGTFGVRGNGFFCSVECGFRWAVSQLRKQQS